MAAHAGSPGYWRGFPDRVLLVHMCLASFLPRALLVPLALLVKMVALDIPAQLDLLAFEAPRVAKVLL